MEPGLQELVARHAAIREAIAFLEPIAAWTWLRWAVAKGLPVPKLVEYLVEALRSAFEAVVAYAAGGKSGSNFFGFLLEARYENCYIR